MVRHLLAPAPAGRRGLRGRSSGRGGRATTSGLFPCSPGAGKFRREPLVLRNPSGNTTGGPPYFASTSAPGDSSSTRRDEGPEPRSFGLVFRAGDRLLRPCGSLLRPSLCPCCSSLLPASRAGRPRKFPSAAAPRGRTAGYPRGGAMEQTVLVAASGKVASVVLERELASVDQLRSKLASITNTPAKKQILLSGPPYKQLQNSALEEALSGQVRRAAKAARERWRRGVSWRARGPSGRRCAGLTAQPRPRLRPCPACHREMSASSCLTGG